MQPMQFLKDWLDLNANQQHYLFTHQNLRQLFPEMSDGAFKTLLSRSVKTGCLTRLCRGIYTYKKVIPHNGLILFHIAALLRADHFNYISLETVLSDVGIISQIPINTISIMSSGRTNMISCGEYGIIEFVHTTNKPIDLVNELSYDSNTRMWRATVSQAMRDMKVTRRNKDLIDWRMVHEFV